MNRILKQCAKWEPCFETMNIVANDGHGLFFNFYKKIILSWNLNLKMIVMLWNAYIHQQMTKCWSMV
jgi:hypothetical protein